VAKLLASAKQPLLITANAGRTAQAAAAVTALAEQFAIPVVHYRPRYFALSTEHPMHAGWEPHALLAEADLVLVVDCDVPWLISQANPKAEAKVVHIGPDPLFARYPMRSFRTDIALTGLVAPALAQLLERALAHAPSASTLAARRDATANRNQAARRQRPRWHCFAAAGPDREVRLGVPQFNPGRGHHPRERVPAGARRNGSSRALRYFASAPAGGLGWGLGAALGAKLAAPDRTVICAVGDGAYMFGNPTPAHFVSEGMKLPVLFVVFNNARWAAVHRSTLCHVPEGRRRTGRRAAVRSARTFAALRERNRGERRLWRAGVRAARADAGARACAPRRSREKRQALVNVRLEAIYAKTS
jgi:acetolactate synthase-1/2/3 large subunit